MGGFFSSRKPDILLFRLITTIEREMKLVVSLFLRGDFFFSLLPSGHRTRAITEGSGVNADSCRHDDWGWVNKWTAVGCGVEARKDGNRTQRFGEQKSKK